MSIQFDKVINQELGRPLTSDELTAVKWWLNIVGFGDHYDNALKSLIICGNINRIQHDFIKYWDNPEWIEKTRKKREEDRYFEQWADEEELAELERQVQRDAIRALGGLGNLIVDSVTAYGRHLR